MWGFNEKNKQTRGRKQQQQQNRRRTFQNITTTTGFFELFRQKRADA